MNTYAVGAERIFPKEANMALAKNAHERTQKEFIDTISRTPSDDGAHSYRKSRDPKIAALIVFV